MYSHDVALVLIYESPDVTDKKGRPIKAEKTFTRQNLFSKNGTEISYGVANHVTIDIVCKDNILLINTSNVVDVHLFDSLPVSKLVVITNGGCALSSKKETLENIDIDIKSGAIVFDYKISNAKSVKLTTSHPNSAVFINKPVTTDTLIIDANKIELCPEVKANKTFLNGKLQHLKQSQTAEYKDNYKEENVFKNLYNFIKIACTSMLKKVSEFLKQLFGGKDSKRQFSESQRRKKNNNILIKVSSDDKKEKIRRRDMFWAKNGFIIKNKPKEQTKNKEVMTTLIRKLSVD